MTPNIATCPALLFRVAASRPFGILLPQSHLFGGPSHTNLIQTTSIGWHIYTKYSGTQN